MYIAIRHLSLNADTAEYAFGEEESRMGHLCLDLTTGSASLVEACPGDHNEGVYQRAARKLFLHWKNSETPDSTCRSS